MDAPQGYKLNAAVFYPSGEGPFPLVIVLHGTAGFVARSAIQGQEFAKAGFLTVAGAWFKGNADKEFQALIPISSPKGPPFQGSNIDSTKYIKALISAAQVLPGAVGRNVGLYGVSRGASEALLVASTDVVQAVVSDSAPYNAHTSFDTAPIAVVKDLAAPVLMLHGTADKTVPLQDALDYERALRDLNKPFEVHYYEGAPHGVTVYPGTKVDAMGRAATFFKKHLASAVASADKN